MTGSKNAHGVVLKTRVGPEAVSVERGPETRPAFNIGGSFQGIIDWFARLFNAVNTPTVEEVSQSAQGFFDDFNTDVFQWDNAEAQG
ncbi:MAG: hypothetical protein Q4A07_05270 [Coriobacteriales bacterium]|nr:hypothetical protein [Coriobacteriales bacterium]